jgi:cytochrome c
MCDRPQDHWRLLIQRLTIIKRMMGQTMEQLHLAQRLSFIVLVSAALFMVFAGANGSRAARSATGSPRTAPVNMIGNPTRGAILYQACTGCHSLDENDVGPRHRGVVGRRAASVEGYAYSPALRRSGIIWTPAALDRWLANPQRLVPRARMYFSVANPQSRADIIAYLGQQR